MPRNKSLKMVLIMSAIFIATFMTSVEITIVTTALPTIISKLDGLSMQSWVFAMYLLTTAISTPIYGKLSDRIGRQPIFMMGLLIFSIGSFLCGIASNIYFLILFRAIQGIGAGAIMPITFTIIADLFSYEKRSKMLALNNTAWGISALMGPLLGGFIIDKLNWHWIFFINVPLGVIVLFFVLVGFQEKRHIMKIEVFDIAGIIALSGTLTSLLLLFQILGNKQSNISLVVLCAILFLVFLFWFVKAEKNASDPIIPLKLFNNRLFTIEIVTATLLSGLQMGLQVYFPIWLQSIYKMPASIAGLAVTSSPVMWLISSFFVGSLVRKYSPKRIILPIVIFQMLFYLPLIIAGVNLPIFWLYITSGVTGAGLGVIITMNILISQRVIDDNEIGTVSSTVTLGRSVGQTIMTGVFGLIFNHSVNHNIVEFKNIKLSQVNQFISSGRIIGGSESTIFQLQKVTLAGIHSVFMVVIGLFVLIIIINLFDKNSEIVK